MTVRRQMSIPFLDKAESISTFSAYVASADLVTQDSTGLGKINTLKSSLALISLASVTNVIASVERPTANPPIPSDDAAYNGNKLTVYFRDTVTGDKYHVTIPAVDPAAYNTALGTKNVLLTVAEGGTQTIEDFVTAFEDVVLSKDGNAVAVSSIKKSSARQGG